MNVLTPSAPVLALDPRLDWRKHRAAFRRAGRVSLVDFLRADSADALSAHLAARTDWTMVFNAGAKTYELPRAQRRTLSADQWRALEESLDQAGRWDFQYRYEAIRVPDDQAARLHGGTLLDRFALFLSSAPVIEMLGKIVGHAGIDLIDAQATCYSTGDFLTCHDDDVAGKGRRAAYVYGLSPAWRAEWGGLLLFHGEDGRIEEGFSPRFNTLNIFAVPASHSVSTIAPIAGANRLSITGWLRTTKGC